jgi:hypothetical protein
MRALVRALSALLIAVPVALAPPASAQDRRVIITEGADYFGADYDVRRDVDLNACTAACQADPQCQAFTFNEAAGWCFLKSDVGELRAVAGAVSGKIADAADVQPDFEAQRVSELSFLDQTFLDEARRFVGGLNGTDLAGLDVAAAIAEAEAANAGGDPLRASELYRVALAQAPERLDLWLAFTDAALRASSDDWEVQERLAQVRVAGAVNAFLRSVSPEEQAHALELLGNSLGGRDNWKGAIRAYRASLAAVESEARRSTYETMLKEHGFRILEHVVEADTAAPRICINFSDRLAEGRGDLADFVTVAGGPNVSIEATGQQICLDGVQHGSRYNLTIREGLPSAGGETLAASADLEIFVRDRAPSVRFPGTAYVLPAGRRSDHPGRDDQHHPRRRRALPHRRPPAGRDDRRFHLSEPARSWEADEIEAKSGIKVWSGSVEVGSEINREIPALFRSRHGSELQPGAYILVAQAVNIGHLTITARRRRNGSS